VDWKIKEVLSIIEKENRASDVYGHSLVVLLGCNNESYNFSTFRYYMELEHIKAIPVDLAISPYRQNILNEGNYDLLVYKTGGRILSIARYVNMNPEKFTIVYNELLPDKTRIIVYKLVKRHG
jgi:hypothetical protein